MTFHFPDLRFSELAVSRLLKRGIEINGQVVESLCALERHFAEIEFELKFEITEECNLVCSFCHQEFGQRKNCSKPFALEEFRQVMEMAQREPQIKYIRLTGGEPTLHPQCLDFLRCVKQAGLTTILNTNATTLNANALWEYLPWVDLWKVSLPAPTEGKVAESTRNSEAFDQKLKTLQWLDAHGASVDILVVLTHDNILALAEFYKFKEKFPSFTMTFLRQESNAHIRKPLSREDIRRTLEFMEKNGGEISLALPFCCLGKRNAARISRRARGRLDCGPFSSLVVRNRETVHPCYSRRALRDIGTSFLATARKLAAEDFSSLPEPCIKCKYAVPCLGGCRCGLSFVNSPVGQMDYLADSNLTACL